MEVRSILLVPLRAGAYPWSIDAHINKHHNPYDPHDINDLSLLCSLLQRCTLFRIQPGAHKAHP